MEEGRNNLIRGSQVHNPLSALVHSTHLRHEARVGHLGAGVPEGGGQGAGPGAAAVALPGEGAVWLGQAARGPSVWVWRPRQVKWDEAGVPLHTVEAVRGLVSEHPVLGAEAGLASGMKQLRDVDTCQVLYYRAGPFSGGYLDLIAGGLQSLELGGPGEVTVNLSG